ncbi:MAG: MmcQ/YjbR family DNA-binding protein [Methanobacterium sp.]
MGKAKFNPKHKEILDSFLLEKPGVVPGKMFGYPAYYVNKKLFACLYEDGVGIKVTEDNANELIGSEGIIPFQPLGRRKMREWIQINREKSEDYLKDEKIFEISIEFVSALASKKK